MTDRQPSIDLINNADFGDPLRDVLLGLDWVGPGGT